MHTTMTDIFATNISAFKSATDTRPATVTLRQFLFSKKHAEQIIALRDIQEKEARDILKKQLPAATISGTFTKRAAAHITAYNGLVCLDFDAGDNPDIQTDEMKRRLADFDEVAYAAVSVGGKGVFAILQTNNTDPTEHARLVDLLGTLISLSCQLRYDRACKDVSRLRFVSFDSEAWVNPAPAVFDFTAICSIEAARPPRPVLIKKSPIEGGKGGDRRNKTDHTRERVEALISAVEQSRADLTDPYDDWMRLGFAIAAHFGMDGEDYYQRLSQFHPDYDSHETAKKYADFVRNGRRIRIGTFFKILENKGFSL